MQVDDQDRGEKKRKTPAPSFLDAQAMQRKKRGVAMTWGEGELRRTDTVRVEPGVLFYGHILEADPCEGRDGEITSYYMRVECINAEWFRLLPDDFHGLDWTQAAVAASACHVELTVSPDELAQMTNRLGGEAEIEKQVWIKIWFDRRENGVFGVPVTIYIPSEGNANPASIAIFGQETLEYMATRIEKIRKSTQTYKKLLRFEEYISTR
jgi:hypothetical protein